MKTSILVAAFLATSLFVPSTQAADPSGTVANFSLALTLKTAGPGTFLRDANGKFVKDGVTNQRIPAASNEWSVTKGDKTTTSSETNVKVTSTKYGNKELLTDLLNEGILPGTSITGWSLKVVSVGSALTQFTFAVKKGAPAVNLDNKIGFTSFNYAEDEPSAQITSINQLVIETFVGEEQTGIKYNILIQAETLNAIAVRINDTGGNLYGLATYSQKFVVNKAGQPISVVKVSMPVVAGTFVTDGVSSFAKGSMNISGAKLVEDLTTVLGDL